MKKMHLTMSAALALALTMTMAAQANEQNVQAQRVAEGTRQVKMFVFDEINTPNCTVQKGSTLKYYSDGAMSFDGNVMCKQSMTGDEFEMEFDMLSQSGEKFFDKEFERHHINEFTNQWFPMSEAYHTNNHRSNHWENVHQVRFVPSDNRS